MNRNLIVLLERSLTAKERQLLDFISLARFATTSQLSRLYFTGYKTEPTGKRIARLTLNKMAKNKLIAPCNNRYRIGKRGSEDNIWMLTETGHSVLTLNNPDKKRKRFIEPSLEKLNHTVAITAMYVEIYELSKKEENLELLDAQFEPLCWRPFILEGKRIFQKPDLFIRLRGRMGDKTYTDSFFLEMDLATESMQIIENKCLRYHQYRATKLEQERWGGFPLVVWVVPSESRKERIIALIKEKFNGYPRIFIVITPDKLLSTIKGEFTKDLLL